MYALIYTLYHTRHHTSLTHCTTSLAAVSIHCLFVQRITSILHPQIFGSFHYRLFPVIFLTSKISTASSVSASRRVPTPPHSITCSLRHKNFQFLYASPQAFSVTSPLVFNITFTRLSVFRSYTNISDMLFSPCEARVHLIFSLPTCTVGDHKISILSPRHNITQNRALLGDHAARSSNSWEYYSVLVYFAAEASNLARNVV